MENPELELTVDGKRFRVVDPGWVNGSVQAWFWNDDIGDWDEVLNMSRLSDLERRYRAIIAKGREGEGEQCDAATEGEPC